MLWTQSLLWLQMSYTLKSVAAAEFNALWINVTPPILPNEKKNHIQILHKAKTKQDMLIDRRHKATLQLRLEGKIYIWQQ